MSTVLYCCALTLTHVVINESALILAGKHSFGVDIKTMEYQHFVKTCTYANLSRINAHHRTHALFSLWQHTNLLFDPAIFGQIDHLFGAIFERRSVFSVIVIFVDFLVAVDLEVIAEVITNVVRLITRVRIRVFLYFGIKNDAF